MLSRNIYVNYIYHTVYVHYAQHAQYESVVCILVEKSVSRELIKRTKTKRENYLFPHLRRKKFRIYFVFARCLAFDLYKRAKHSYTAISFTFLLVFIWCSLFSSIGQQQTTMQKINQMVALIGLLVLVATINMPQVVELASQNTHNFYFWEGFICHLCRIA